MDVSLPNASRSKVRRGAVRPGQGDEIGQVVALALAVDEAGADNDSPNASRLEYDRLRFGGAMAPPNASTNGGGTSASGGANTEAGRGTG